MSSHFNGNYFIRHHDGLHAGSPSTGNSVWRVLEYQTLQSLRDTKLSLCETDGNRRMAYFFRQGFVVEPRGAHQEYVRSRFAVFHFWVSTAEHDVMKFGEDVLIVGRFHFERILSAAGGHGNRYVVGV